MDTGVDLNNRFLQRFCGFVPYFTVNLTSVVPSSGDLNPDNNNASRSLRFNCDGITGTS